MLKQKDLRFKSIMTKLHFFIKIFILYLFFISNLFAAKNNHFEEGKLLFDEKKFDESKIFFEREIVFNPKSERSYLYLAKISKDKEDEDGEEVNLNNVLLLNPQNDEAIYMLILLKIKQSDYNYSKELIEKFNLVCNSFCNKKKEIKNKFDKLIPENAKDNN